MKRIHMTLATTVPVQSYGGLQLSLENLESMRQELVYTTNDNASFRTYTNAGPMQRRSDGRA